MFPVKSRELLSHTKTSILVSLYDLRDLIGNISSIMTKHIVVHRRLQRVAQLIIQIIYAIYYNLFML